ncbi:MAG: hypothetical protein HC824_02330 [Synechococcales cyanobacterium RM1_1_8]|nr:hypothetical protein [Synechococcales cyanobacterium RM1_1_8]
MDSQELGQYITETDGFSKPWLLVQLRLKKLEERRAELEPGEYLHQLADIHQDLMKLGEWWKGQEQEVFEP